MPSNLHWHGQPFTDEKTSLTFDAGEHSDNRGVSVSRNLSRSLLKKPGIQNTVRLSSEGLAKVLGDLEARVLRSVWQIGAPATARVVHAVVVRRHRVELPTVITVLNKLVTKGVLRRAKRDELLHYEARLGEEEFLAMASRRVVEGILNLGPQAVSASLVDVLAERDPEQLAELGRLVRRKLREQGET